jgi:arylsulfatase A
MHAAALLPLHFMNTRILTLLCTFILGSFRLSNAAETLAVGAPTVGPRLNVVVMLIDDLGATDLGFTGSPYYETPHLDRLAKESCRFTQAYSACTVCSPTRASLLTGHYPARLHVTDWIPGHGRPHAALLPPEWTQQLVTSTRTLAEHFHEAGYATASIGKWHLGGEDSTPQQHGFDVNIAGTHRGQPPSYFSPYGIATIQDGPVGEYLTDRESTEACAWITQQAQPAAGGPPKPFFLYLPHHAVHTPLAGKKEVLAKYAAKPSPQGKPAYAALVESVDDSVGQLRAHLEKLGLWDRTVFIFTSDNGGLLQGQTTHNLGLRAGKGSAYEGGVRIPLLIHAPGVRGSTCAVPVITPDLFPTVLDLALGSKRPRSSEPVDGQSLTPLLYHPDQPWTREAIYWHYPHYHPGGATPYSAVRAGAWKLIHFYEGDRDELFHLAADPQEKSDLSATEGPQRQKLRALLETWLTSTGAQPPRPNPAANPTKDPAPKADPK